MNALKVASAGNLPGDPFRGLDGTLHCRTFSAGCAPGPSILLCRPARGLSICF